MKRTSAILLAALTALLALLPAACSAPEGSTGDGGFALNVCIASEPETIDPQLNSALDSGTMLNHMFEGLTKWVDDGEGNAVLAAGQAERWDKETNADGTVTYTFHLRDDIFWSDGEKVTAQDFVYAWRRLAAPETGADYANMLDMVAGYDGVHYGYDADGKVASYEGAEAVAFDQPDSLGVRAEDERTLVVTLSYDCPYFEEVCAFPACLPVRQDAVEGGSQWTYDPATYVTNGPYRMSERVPNSHITLVKNERYYNVEALGPDTITFRLMDDANAILNSYRSGELQFIQSIPVDEVASYLASGELHVDDYLGTYYVCFQTKQPPFDDVRVRKAFSLVIDRNYIVRQITQTGQMPADAFVPYGMADADPEGKDFRTVGGGYYSVSEADYAANCEEARRLISEAGYPNGEGFPAVEYLYNTGSQHRAVAEALQQMWQKELGVTVTLNNQEWGAFLQTRNQGNFSLARSSWTADYNDPMCFLDMWVTGGGNNDAQYSSAAYDAAIAAAKSTSDPQARMDSMHQAERILIEEDAVVAPIYFYTQMYLLDDTVSGVYYTPLGYYLFLYARQG